MCGIVGIADFRGGPRPDAGVVASMAETLRHRGPDGSCIVELGAGARSYGDEQGRLRAICNGEIYNDPELRRELTSRGHRFETRCDTEVIPHLYEEHGLGFVHRLNGMFAFAIFDMAERRLVLGRDRA